MPNASSAPPPAEAARVGPSRRRALVLASEGLCVDIERILSSLSLTVAFVTPVDVFSAIVEAGCPQNLINHTDLLSLPGDLCRMAHSLRPDVLTVALVNHWSEREERLKGTVDAVLHKPPRRLEEWQELFG